MAKPRVFLSSTYFDLKAVRADLEAFIRDRGFDPVLHEKGNIPYGNSEALEKYCYREVENCDILISLIGGRFGSQARETDYSISQMELRAALDRSRQVYVYVERTVFHEYDTFELNPEAKIAWASVDDSRIFKFLKEVRSLKNNNPIVPFDNSLDIVENLKEQWAGLFQRLLSHQFMHEQSSMIADLKQTIETAKALTDIVSAQADRGDEVVAGIILANHPLFAALRRKMAVPYRFIVESIDELGRWMKARGFEEEPFVDPDLELGWYRNSKGNTEVESVTVARSVFDDEGRLSQFSDAAWQDGFVVYQKRKTSKPKSAFDADLDDDVPF